MAAIALVVPALALGACEPTADIDGSPSAPERSATIGPDTSADAALITFFVRRLSGEQDCIGSEPFPIKFTLPEPLGARRLLDGSEVPPRDATTPAQ